MEDLKGSIHALSPQCPLPCTGWSCSQQPAMTNPQGTRGGMLSDRYKLGEELGRGAYGQVFKCTDITTEETVAIKQISLAGMSQDNLQGVVGEIDLLKTLNHKNIVKYIGSFKTRTHLYIILEWVAKCGPAASCMCCAQPLGPAPLQEPHCYRSMLQPCLELPKSTQAPFTNSWHTNPQAYVFMSAGTWRMVLCQPSSSPTALECYLRRWQRCTLHKFCRV